MKEILDEYLRAWQEPDTVVSRFRQLLAEVERPADRGSFPGHLTGSALLVTADRKQVLLTLHRKLGKWLQLGGHADGSLDLAGVALREAHEESGLTDVEFLRYEDRLGSKGHPLPIDVDVHWIPPGKEPGHYHYDVRYALVAPHPENIVLSDESNELRWFDLAAAYRANEEPSLHRLFDKLTRLDGLLR